jgi:hypothetical protein
VYKAVGAGRRADPGLRDHLPLANTQDEDNLREALRYSSAMLGELRTSYLSPQKYYELYMQVFDQLAHLEVCLRAGARHRCCRHRLAHSRALHGAAQLYPPPRAWRCCRRSQTRDPASSIPQQAIRRAAVCRQLLALAQQQRSSAPLLLAQPPTPPKPTPPVLLCRRARQGPHLL